MLVGARWWSRSVVEVVVVGRRPVRVTTSCGLVRLFPRLEVGPVRSAGFASTKAKVPLPLTTLVTSNSTQLLAGRLAALATTAPLAGAVFHVMPSPSRPCRCVDSVTPWFVPFDPTRRRTLALSTGVVSPVVVNFRYEFTAALEACSTRSGSVSKLVDGRFCSTRASAVAMNVTGAVAPPAGIGLATATAPPATTTAATNVRAQGARRGETDKLRGSQPARRAAPATAPGVGRDSSANSGQVRPRTVFSCANRLIWTLPLKRPVRPARLRVHVLDRRRTGRSAGRATGVPRPRRVRGVGDPLGFESRRPHGAPPRPGGGEGRQRAARPPAHRPVPHLLRDRTSCRTAPRPTGGSTSAASPTPRTPSATTSCWPCRRSS